MDKVSVIVNMAVCPPEHTKALEPGQIVELDAETAARYIAAGYVYESKPGARPPKDSGAMKPIQGHDE